MAPPLAATIKKIMGAGASLLRLGFNPSKCKTEAKMATARIKLLQNRREVQVRQMRRDIAALIESGREETARIRVEHVIREQNAMAANEIIELFCELVVARLPIITKQRVCPSDLKEAIASLIYAAPRCSDIPELYRLRNIFEKKYGKEFASAATDLCPDSGVNPMLIEKLSVRKPSGEVKLKIMKEIAKEYQIKWDTAESECQLLRPAEELLVGPRCFSSAASMPVKLSPMQYVHQNDPKLSEGAVMQFRDSTSAAQAAAESAKKAITAAQAAAYLAKQSSQALDRTTSSETSVCGSMNSNRTVGSPRQSLNSSQKSAANKPSVKEPKPSSRVLNSQSFNMQNHMYDEDMDTASSDDNNLLRSNTCIDRVSHSKINFDDSDGLDSECGEVGTEARSLGTCSPPNRPPPVRPSAQPQSGNWKQKVHTNKHLPNPNAHVHPKLPDYESLAARFEALKSPRPRDTI